MKRDRLALIVFMTAMAFCTGPFSGTAEASQRYGYRYRPAYRTYHYRPYRYAYRPYYRSYYRPYYRPYFSFGFGAWPYFGAYWGPTYAPYYSVSAYHGGQVGYSYQSGSVRTQVQPKATEVYVDGYYAGIVDDFDGTFQRLYVPPGQHQIELRLDGHRTYRQTLLVNSGTTYKIHHQMVPLGPGETNPPPTEPRQEPPPQERTFRSEEPAPPPREERPPREPNRPATTAAFGMLSLRVKPADAEIVIDGERWGNLEGMEQMIIHLPAGRHHIEIRKEGYGPFVTEVEIVRGVETPLNVRLAL